MHRSATHLARNAGIASSKAIMFLTFIHVHHRGPLSAGVIGRGMEILIQRAEIPPLSEIRGILESFSGLGA